MKKQGELPYEQSQATRMLQAGLDKASADRGLSTRAAARALGYKATVVMSHMATGRVPIPLDRAAEIAEVVGIDKHAFFRAVLEQRHPGSLELLGMPPHAVSQEPGFLTQIELLAGSSLEDLPDEHKAVIREVVSERSPRRRWLTLAELPAVLALRRIRPDMPSQGLGHAEIAALEQALG